MVRKDQRKPDPEDFEFFIPIASSPLYNPCPA